GMGGSIAAGMRVARQWPLDGIIVMLCDQPFITPEHLRQLGAESTRHRIVNTSCDGQSGPPAWFSPAYFDQLCSLSGNRGAKALIEGESRRAQIDFPDAKWDIDTAEDLAVLAPRIDPD
ncbi:MAG: nucleotidyltransferase family protein, partial [Verrucomicrobiaceae bacterium]